MAGPFLCIGVMWGLFHTSGRDPLVKDCWADKNSGVVKEAAQDFNR